MAGYNLTEGLSGSPHPTDHNKIHDIVNKFDKDDTPATGHALGWDNTTSLYRPTGMLWAVFYTGSAWPDRPSGAPSIIAWISTAHAAAAAQTINGTTKAFNGDLWFRHPNPV